MGTCSVWTRDEVFRRSTATNALTYSPRVASVEPAWPPSNSLMTDSESPLLFSSFK